MGQIGSQAQAKAAFLGGAEALYDELQAWRQRHLTASFDEIAAQMMPRRRELMGLLLKQLAEAADERVTAPLCPECEQAMTYKGTPARGVSHKEGETRLERAYYYCAACGSTLFPPGRAAGAEPAQLECGHGAGGRAAGGGDRLL